MKKRGKSLPLKKGTPVSVMLTGKMEKSPWGEGAYHHEASSVHTWWLKWSWKYAGTPCPMSVVWVTLSNGKRLRCIVPTELVVDTSKPDSETVLWDA